MREFLIETIRFCTEAAIVYLFGHLVAIIVVRKIKKELKRVVNTPNGVTKKELIELLKPFPDDAIVVVECCNIRKMEYSEIDNTIRID